MRHSEIEELLAAYAIDAVEDDEASVVRAHLLECARCRAEVADYRETAALLAHSDADAPPHIWDRIVEDLDLGTAELEPIKLFGRSGRASWARPALAAASIVALLGAGAVVGRSVLPRKGQSEALSTAVIAALTAPGARQVHLSSGDGRTSADVVVTPDGMGYVARSNLPALPSQRTYQVWGQVGDQKISLGVLGGTASQRPFAAHAPLVALAITVEAAGGAIQPTNPPVVAGLVKT